jgi:hypothetical protein
MPEVKQFTSSPEPKKSKAHFRGLKIFTGSGVYILSELLLSKKDWMN